LWLGDEIASRGTSLIICCGCCGHADDNDDNNNVEEDDNDKPAEIALIKNRKLELATK
jgi:hypothetical protein